MKTLLLTAVLAFNFSAACLAVPHVSHTVEYSGSVGTGKGNITRQQNGRNIFLFRAYQRERLSAPNSEYKLDLGYQQKEFSAEEKWVEGTWEEVTHEAGIRHTTTAGYDYDEFEDDDEELEFVIPYLSLPEEHYEYEDGGLDD